MILISSIPKDRANLAIQSMNAGKDVMVDKPGCVSIKQLNELKTENIEPLSSVAETKLRLRKDQIKSKNIREEILKNSPDENKDFFVVPKVVE